MENVALPKWCGNDPDAFVAYHRQALESEFVSKQQNQIDKVRALLNQDWQRSAVDILREELENLDKDQTTTFFDSVAALMSNQVRELATKSIQEYIDFFGRFKKENGSYPTPSEIIKREYGPGEKFE